MNLKFVLINSTLAYIAATLLATIIHEAGHFITALSLGLDATLYHNYVVSGEKSDFLSSILVPAGGPVISLISGILFLYTFNKISNPFISLLVFWLGIKGVISFLGYLMIAPFVAVGDTGKIFSLIEMPMVWQLAIMVVSLLVAVLFLLKLHRGYEVFIHEDLQPIDKHKKGKWANALIMYPIFIGIVVTTLLAFPIPHIVSILPATTMPFMLFMTYGKIITSKNQLPANGSKNFNSLSYWLILISLVAVILNRVLVFGLML